MEAELEDEYAERTSIIAAELEDEKAERT